MSSRLKCLDITGVDASDASLVSLVSNLPGLVSLSLAKTKASDATVNAMAGRLLHLRSLSLAGCEIVTNESIFAVVGAFPEPAQVSLDLTACRSLQPDKEFVEMLTTSLKQCTLPDTTDRWKK